MQWQIYSNQWHHQSSLEGSEVIWTIHSKHWSTLSSQWQAKPFHLRGHCTRWRRGPGRGDNALGNWVCMHHVASYKLCKPHRSDFWRVAQSVFCGQCLDQIAVCRPSDTWWPLPRSGLSVIERSLFLNKTFYQLTLFVNRLWHSNAWRTNRTNLTIWSENPNLTTLFWGISTLIEMVWIYLLASHK